MTTQATSQKTQFSIEDWQALQEKFDFNQIVLTFKDPFEAETTQSLKEFLLKMFLRNDHGFQEDVILKFTGTPQELVDFVMKLPRFYLWDIVAEQIDFAELSHSETCDLIVDSGSNELLRKAFEQRSDGAELYQSLLPSALRDEATTTFSNSYFLEELINTGHMPVERMIKLVTEHVHGYLYAKPVVETGKLTFADVKLLLASRLGSNRSVEILESAVEKCQPTQEDLLEICFGKHGGKLWPKIRNMLDISKLSSREAVQLCLDPITERDDTKHLEILKAVSLSKDEMLSLAMQTNSGTIVNYLIHSASFTDLELIQILERPEVGKNADLCRLIANRLADTIKSQQAHDS